MSNKEIGLQMFGPGGAYQIGSVFIWSDGTLRIIEEPEPKENALMGGKTARPKRVTEPAPADGD